MRRRDFCQLVLGGLGSLPVFALESVRTPSGAPTLGLAINKAGRQRMLTQRMAKAFAMLLLGVLPDKAASLLDQSRRLFEQQLLELKTQQASEAIVHAWLELDRAWGGYRDTLSGAKTLDQGRLVLLEAEKTLRAAHVLTGLYEKQSGSTAGHLVNLSGRQRMLSQRMAKCYCFERAGLGSEALRNELQTARQEFVAALAELNAARENTPEIRLELELANTQWLFFEQALNGREGQRDIALRNVVTTSERILEVMDSLTGRYEKLVRN